MVIGVEPDLIAELHNYYRSSPVGRRYLGRELMTHIEELEDINKDTTHVNRNVEILQAYLKSMGLQLRYPNKDKLVIRTYDGHVASEEINKKIVIGSDEDLADAKRKKVINDILTKKCFVGTKDEYNKIVKRAIDNDKKKEKKIVIDVEDIL